MDTLMRVMVRFFCLGLLGIGFAACTGDSDSGTESEKPRASNILQIYGFAWSGDIRSTTGDMLMVEACWNDDCRSQSVPVAGLAPESSWDQYRPGDAPAGAPSQSPWAAPKAGECHTFYEWHGDLGISSCATTAGAEASKVHVQVFLDLSVVGSALRTGDEASLHVTSVASDASLVERTTTIEAVAPYYVELDVEE